LGKVGGTWASLLLVKHVVVVIMLILGSYLDGLIVRAAKANASGDHLSRVLWTSRGMALLGGAVLLLTAAAQSS
jgi:putative copper export protein